ncbi:MAG: hypothetical protein ACR2QC_07660 [Gammaproteobacteria bacterium]
MKIVAPPPPCDSLILRIFRVLAVFLAAILGTTAANAQEARAQVYSKPTANFSIFGRTVDLDETLVEIIADFTGGVSPFAAFDSYWARIDSDGGFTAAGQVVGNDGLPTFGGDPVAAGNRIIITDAIATGAAVITVRVYRNSVGILALADGEVPAGRIAAASDLVAGEEFFLLTTGDVWTEVPNARSGTREYEAPTCDPDGLTPDLSADGSICEAVAVATPNLPADSDSVPTPGGDGDARDLAVVGLGVGVVGFMAAYLSGGDFSLFNFAPDFGYSLNESSYSVNTGGRLNFRKDNWHLYYAAGQENANGEFGDFRYESGGEYSADLWTAAFSETVQGETADYNFALSADYHGGIWRLSPTYRLHSRLDEDETETRNSLNLESVLRYNRWTIRPSAGFRWESADEFGDNARFNLSAVRRF